MKKILLFLIFGLFYTELAAQSTHSLNLHTGQNIITFGLANESGTILKSLKVIPDAEKMSNGLRVEESVIPIDLTSKALEISLRIIVDQGHEGKKVTLPLILIGDTGHRWYVEPYATIEARQITKSELLPNYPNPFNPETTIHYRLAGNVGPETKVVIYDIIGQVIRTLVQEYQSPGEYMVHWDGMDDHGQKVASGIYMYQLTSGDFSQIRRMMLLK